MMPDDERELRRLLSTDDLGDLLTWMERHGSSVLLGWGEDDGRWECSWITSGRRHTGFSHLPGLAVFLAAREVLPS